LGGCRKINSRQNNKHWVSPLSGIPFLVDFLGAYHNIKSVEIPNFGKDTEIRPKFWH